MRNYRFLLLIVLFAICAACNSDKTKGYYNVYYSFAGVTFSVHKDFQVVESYIDRIGDGGVSRILDSTGVINTWRSAISGKIDTAMIVQEKVISDPYECLAAIKRVGETTGNINSNLWIVRQDTVVKYDTQIAKQPEFERRYLKGPTPTSFAWEDDKVYTEVIKNGKLFIKVSDPESDMVTYAGMVDKYWFRLSFTLGREDAALVNRMWEQSRFD